MFVNMLNKSPIKVWMDKEDSLELGALQQVSNVANLPFVHKHVALMPDAHQGYGVPIGCVFATIDAIIPNAVGKDIGCGVLFIQTKIKAEQMSKRVLQQVVGDIMKAIPIGFSHHQKEQDSEVLQNISTQFSSGYYNDELMGEIRRALKQVGTLGGGNHFIEIQKDEEGYLCIMIHSGSRNFGYRIARAFDHVADTLNTKWHTGIPLGWGLSFLPLDSAEGQDYIDWMNLAMEFAEENRITMLVRVLDVLSLKFHDLTYNDSKFGEILDVSHNYAAIEHHYGKNVWVHRKGATRAREGELGIIPGSMGSPSYIVEGLGNPLSFNSSSHGAGRKMGRKEAKRQFPVQQTVEDLNEKNIVLGKQSHQDVSEEACWAYKDIDWVMSQQSDLVKPLKKLTALAVIKG